MMILQKDDVMIGVIGGTGLRKIEGLNITRESLVDTPYGKPSDKIIIGKLDNRDVAFLAKAWRRAYDTPSFN